MSRSPQRANKLHTSTETGAMLGVSRATVQRMCRNGEITGLRTLGGHWRIPATEIDRVHAAMADIAEWDAASATEASDAEGALGAEGDSEAADGDHERLAS